MIVKCKNGHEFDDSQYWECPECEDALKALMDISIEDVLGGRLG